MIKTEQLRRFSIKKVFIFLISFMFICAYYEITNNGYYDEKYVVFVEPSGAESYWDYGTMKAKSTDRIYIDDPEFSNYIVSCLRNGNEIEFYIYEDDDSDVGYYCRIYPGDIKDALNYLV